MKKTLLLFFFLFLLPIILQNLGMGVAMACSVCRGGATKPELDAYLITIVILGLLPIIIGIGLFTWIFRKKVSKNQ